MRTFLTVTQLNFEKKNIHQATGKVPFNQCSCVFIWGT